jgi:exopolysaccharide production protein ExoQ
VMTKSRTVCGALLIGLLAYGAIGMSWRKRILAFTAMLWSVFALAFIALLLGWDVEHQAVNVALIGREEETGSLSGRVPFWTELMPHVMDRSLLGHGYRTFWDPKRIGDFSNSLQWTVTDGHSAYLDTLLDLGVIGAVLFLASIAAGIREAASGYRTSGDVAYGMFFALLVCRGLNAILESAFVTSTNFVSFVIICGLAHIALRTATNESSSLPDAPIAITSWPGQLQHTARRALR